MSINPSNLKSTSINSKKKTQDSSMLAKSLEKNSTSNDKQTLIFLNFSFKNLKTLNPTK